MSNGNVIRHRQSESGCKHNMGGEYQHEEDTQVV